MGETKRSKITGAGRGESREPAHALALICEGEKLEALGMLMVDADVDPPQVSALGRLVRDIGRHVTSLAAELDESERAVTSIPVIQEGDKVFYRPPDRGAGAKG